MHWNASNLDSWMPKGHIYCTDIFQCIYVYIPMYIVYRFIYIFKYVSLNTTASWQLINFFSIFSMFLIILYILYIYLLT